MTTVHESICCRESFEILEKIEEYGNSIECIVRHPGFESVCLNVWVLQTAGFQHTQEYGQGSLNGDMHELVC